MDRLLIFIVIFLATFTQSVTGFGIALVSMAFLPQLLGIQVATPLVALIGLTLETILFLRYRGSVNFKALGLLTLASMAGIPFGLLALSRLDERLVLTILGFVIGGYALYALLNLQLPRLQQSIWALLFGWLSGALGAAYNTAGPPVIVYGDARRWAPLEFKSNLQGFFVINSVLVVAGHALSGNIQAPVLEIYWPALPVVAAGILAGVSLDNRINAQSFRRIVLVVLVVMGARLVLG